MSAALGTVLPDTDVRYYENFADCNSLSCSVYLFYETYIQTWRNVRVTFVLALYLYYVTDGISIDKL